MLNKRACGLRKDKRKHLWLLAMLAASVTSGWAQTGQPPDSSTAATTSANTDPKADARTGDSSDEAGQKSANSPSDIDQGNMDPTSNRRSFFSAGANVVEGTETSVGSNKGSSSQTSSFTTALGSLHLLSLRRYSDTAIDYLGGAELYGESTTTPIQQLNATDRIRWRRGQLILADEFGDLPGGGFGSEWFGGAAAYNLASAGVNANPPAPPDLAGLLGSINYTGTGISNVSLGELAKTLTPRSSITAAGGYGFTDYSLISAGESLINNHGTAAQASYNYQMSRRNQIGFLYGFQDLQFPEAGQGSVRTNLGEVLYSRQVSSRVDFSLGIGPEFAKLSNGVSGSSSQINASGYVSLNYRLRKGGVAFSCDRLVTNGSGLFAGANTDACQFSFTRPTRYWSTSFDAGYLKLSQIGQVPAAVSSQNYQYGFVGVAVQRQLGGHLGVFGSYQFSDQSRGNYICTLSGPCGFSGGVHSFSIGINLVAPPQLLR